MELRRLGPRPYLGVEIERDIETRIVAKCFNKLPLNRRDVISVANEIKMLLDAGNGLDSVQLNQLLQSHRSTPPDDYSSSDEGSAGIDKPTSFGHNWILRFIARHPQLSPRQCENVSRSRIEVTEMSLIGFLENFEATCRH